MSRSYDRPRLALAGLFVVLVTSAIQARYQDAEVPKYDIKVTASKAAKTDVTLRPNVRQKVYVTVTNPDAKPATLTALVMAGGKVEATGKVELKAGGMEGDSAVVKWLPSPAKKEPSDGPFEIVLADKDGKRLAIPPSPLGTMSPYEYLTIRDFGDDKGKDVPKRLTLEVKARDGFFGAPARVSLDIPPDRIGKDRRGTFSGFVSKDVPLVLSAEPIEDTDGKSKTLRDAYSLQVDGIKRGLFFRVTTRGTRSTVEPDANAAGALALPRITKPTDKLATDVLTSGNIDAKDRVVVELLAEPFKDADSEKDKYTPVATFIGPRQVRMKVDADLDGSLYLEPVATEHKVTLDLSGIIGKTKLRVAIYDALQFDDEGNLKKDAKFKNVELVPQVLHVTDKPPAVKLEALEPVGPVGAKFQPVKEAVRGRVVVFQAKLTAKEADVAKDGVRFYLGAPAADGKMPQAEIPAVPVPGEADTWRAEYKVPAETKTPLFVTVQATDELGLKSAALTAELPVIDPVPGAATVNGKVFEMDIPVDNLPVVLLDSGGSEVAAVRSAGGGKFSIPDVAPGSYFLYARRDQTGAKALMPIKVIKPTRADLVAVDPKEIELILEAPAESKPKEKKKEEKKKEEKKKAKLSGTVVEGDHHQPGVTVRLYEPTGKTVLKTATTDERGEFLFKDLEKGKYIVITEKSASRTKARADVELGEGEARDVGDLKLFR